MKKGRDYLRVVYVKGNLFVFGGFGIDGRWVTSVDKFSYSSKTWSKVAEMYDNRNAYCVCTFMDKVFIFGGSINKYQTNSCLQFDSSDYTFKEVTKMNEARSKAACAVFAERIVVSGGFGTYHDRSKTVELYDVLPNKWSTMPNMNSGKYEHSLVVVNDKLFVISHRRDSCEVFDNVCKKFVTINSPHLNTRFFVNKSCSTGKTIFIFQYESPILICFDTDKNKWSEELCEVSKDLKHFSCVKVPFLHENF